MKNKIIINGLGFGTDINNIKVYLTQSGIRKYTLNVLDISDTIITAYLGGGIPGKYQILVYKNAIGNSYASNIGADIFTY